MKNDIGQHYFDMPEYNNVKQDDPLITALFKFKTQEDFDTFHAIVKEHLYDGKRVFDGMQKKEAKNAWYPLPERPSSYYFGDEE